MVVKNGDNKCNNTPEHDGLNKWCLIMYINDVVFKWSYRMVLKKWAIKMVFKNDLKKWCYSPFVNTICKWCIKMVSI